MAYIPRNWVWLAKSTNPKICKSAIFMHGTAGLFEKWSRNSRKDWKIRLKKRSKKDIFNILEWKVIKHQSAKQEQQDIKASLSPERVLWDKLDPISPCKRRYGTQHLSRLPTTKREAVYRVPSQRGLLLWSDRSSQRSRQVLQSSPNFHPRRESKSHSYHRILVKCERREPHCSNPLSNCPWWRPFIFVTEGTAA